MQVEIKTWLFDILTAIDEITSFFDGEIPSLEAYKKDLKTCRAVERNIEIMGEAINRILTVQPDIQISNARKIVDTRNRIIHGYDSVSDTIIWSIVVKYLPVLRAEVETLLSQ